jgi:hypothetical protein
MLEYYRPGCYISWTVVLMLMSFQRIVWLYLWIAPHVLLIPIAIVMFRKGRHRDFRVFFSYLLFEFAQFGVLFTMWRLKAPALMLLRTDLLCRAGSIAFRFGIIQEMFESPLANSIPLRRTMARMLNWVTALLVVLAVVFIGSLYNSIPNYGLLKNYVPIESLNTAQCGLIVCVFLWYRFLGVRMSRCVFGIALGIGLVAGFEPLMHAWVAGQNLINRDSLQMAIFHVAVLGWLYFVLVRETVASNFNAAQLLQVRDWAAGVGRILQVGRSYSPRGAAAPEAELIPVDVDAFENLTDPEEEQFLRANLSSAEFRGVQRSRIRAAKMYVTALSQNVGVLVAVGQSALSHADPEIAASGEEIFQQAIRLKVWCLLSLLRLNGAMIFPTILSPSRRIVDQYLVVTSMAANLPRKVAA